MKRPISLAVAAVLLAGCGSDEEDATDSVKRPETGADTGAETTAPVPEGTAVFRSDEIDFTFRYPEELEVETEPEEQVLGRVSIDSDGRLNAIKVRRTADRALGPDRYLDEFQRDFSKAVGDVEKREEKIGGREMGVLEFEDSVEEDGETIEFSSSSYFFTGAGRTWQIECIADDEHRDEIEDACRMALESVDFRGAKEEPKGPRPKQVD